MERLKEAHIEASKEIDALKAAKQREFASYEHSVIGSLDQVVQACQRETDAAVGHITTSCEGQREQLIGAILAQVTAVQPAVHQNALLRDMQGKV